ncbi:hypothetical protein BJD99_10515 [Rhodococcus sp. 1163]|uniref:hypothetical protein n=1 Tax=Rhodococcus sp. 1163 TaxID=1905289 RepID=UPI000A02019B|nr:hypothetical protein [Rhodococcus sp. 1163]ORI16917.1 hypothetical protein BJD99_10515 [Rhodococcus sp. 1163]
MARLATSRDSGTNAQSGPLTLADVPKRFRPSRWQKFLDETSTGQIREAVDAGVESDRAREMHAAERQRRAYTQWLEDRDLTTSAGRPIRGWTSTDLARWEESL